MPETPDALAFTPGQLAYQTYRAHYGEPYWPMFDQLSAKEQQAWEAAAEAVLQTWAQGVLAIPMQYGSIDGEHHKTWVIDQMVRALTATPAAYAAWVAAHKDGPDGPDSYPWDEGIAP